MCPWIQIYIYIYQRNAPANSSKWGSLRLAPIIYIYIPENCESQLVYEARFARNYIYIYTREMRQPTRVTGSLRSQLNEHTSTKNEL